MATDNKRDLWIAWTRDAARNYVMPEEIGNVDELVDDMTEVTTAYADEMLDQLDKRFDASGKERSRESDRGARRRPASRKNDDDERTPERDEED